VTRRGPKIATHKATRTAANVAVDDNISAQTVVLMFASYQDTFKVKKRNENRVMQQTAA
jgi:hypothetical protein